MKKPKLTCDVKCINPFKTNSLRSKLPDASGLDLVAEMLTNMADQTRLRILLLLGGRRELCVCDIASVLDVSVALASHHLRKLRDAQLLQSRQKGKLVYYSLTPSQDARLLLSGVRRVLRDKEKQKLHVPEVAGGVASVCR